MWQQYDAGEEVEKGTTVNLKVSKGEPEPEPVVPEEPEDPGNSGDTPSDQEPDTGEVTPDDGMTEEEG